MCEIILMMDYSTFIYFSRVLYSFCQPFFSNQVLSFNFNISLLPFGLSYIHIISSLWYLTQSVFANLNQIALSPSAIKNSIQI